MINKMKSRIKVRVKFENGLFEMGKNRKLLELVCGIKCTKYLFAISVYKLARSPYTYYVCTNFLNKFMKIIGKKCSLRFGMGTTLQESKGFLTIVTAYSILYLLNNFDSWKVKFILASCCRDP